jgi:hypothetical protein
MQRTPQTARQGCNHPSFLTDTHSLRRRPGGPPATLDDRPPTLPVGYFSRLDWRSWFLPLSFYRLLRMGVDPASVSGAVDGWYRKFERRVLEGEPDVLHLICVPPQLAGRRLDAVRTLVYDYDFSDGTQSAAATEHATTTGAETTATGGVKGTGGVGHDAGSAVRRRQTAGEAASEGQQLSRTQLVARAREVGLPGPDWEEGRVWRRRFVCIYDVQARDAHRDAGAEDARRVQS